MHQWPSFLIYMTGLQLTVRAAAGGGIGYVGVHQAAMSGNQTLGDERQTSKLPQRGASFPAVTTGYGGSDPPQPRQASEEQTTEGDLELKQTLEESGNIVSSHPSQAGPDIVEENRGFAAFGHKEMHILERQQYHKIPLQNMDSVQYCGAMMVGEPPQRMKILFDTGSSDTWVPGVGCTSCGLYSAYDYSASLTAVPMGRNFTNRYDSGSVEGSIIKESVLVGGMTVKGVEMGLVKRQEQHIRGFKADGIVGLAFPSISTTRNSSPSQHPTFVQLLQEQFGAAGDLFSVYLTPSPNQPGSMVIFGGYDLDLVRRPRVRPRKKSASQTISSSSSVNSAQGLAGSASSSRPGSEQGYHKSWQRIAAQQQGQQQQQARLRGGEAAKRGKADDRRYAVRADGSLGDGNAWTSVDDAVRAVPGAPRRRQDRGSNLNASAFESDGDGGLSSNSAWVVGGTSKKDAFGEEGEVGKQGQKMGVVGVVQEGEVVTTLARVQSKPGEEKGGHQEERHGDDIDDYQEDEEPVIIWTPVVDYRGSLSYWTVGLTGWRTERTAIAADHSGGAGGGPAGQVAGGGNQHGHGNMHNHLEDYSVPDVTSGREMCPDGCRAIVDTGSSLLVPPRSQYRAVMQEITKGRTDCQDRDGMMVFCSRCREDDFPDIIVSVALAPEQLFEAALKQPGYDGEKGGSGGDSEGGGKSSQEFRLKPSDYLSQSWSGCEILVGEGRATDIWTLGDAFIKTYMTIFDVANLRVGFVCPDGGRCLGGASAPWRPSTRFCWPIFGGASDPVESAGRFGSYCLYFQYNFVGWALMITSVLLFAIGCLLFARESNNINSSRISIGIIRTSSSSSSSAHSMEPMPDDHAPLSNPPFPFLSTGQQECNRKQPPHMKESHCGTILMTGDTEAVRRSSGRSCDPRSLHSDRRYRNKRKSPQHQPDGYRKGGGNNLPGWTRRSKDFVLSFADRVSAVVWCKTEAVPASSNPQQLSPSNELPLNQKGTTEDRQRRDATLRNIWSFHGGGGSANAVGALSGDGIRSRGGTPRPDQPSPDADGHCVCAGGRGTWSNRIGKLW